jgi:hypothetical protein
MCLSSDQSAQDQKVRTSTDIGTDLRALVPMILSRESSSGVQLSGCLAWTKESSEDWTSLNSSKLPHGQLLCFQRSAVDGIIADAIGRLGIIVGIA